MDWLTLGFLGALGLLSLVSGDNKKSPNKPSKLDQWAAAAHARIKEKAELRATRHAIEKARLENELRRLNAEKHNKGRPD